MFLMFLVLLSNYGQIINHNTGKGPQVISLHREYRKFKMRNTAHRTVWDQRNTARWDFIHGNTAKY